MLARQDERMSAREFLEWAERQQARYELIHGFATEMMAGARKAHGVVVSNLAVLLASPAKRRGCQLFIADLAVVCAEDQVRYPDLVVDCAPLEARALNAAHPVVLVEILSDTTSYIDVSDTLEEYKALPSARMIVFIEPEEVAVKVYRRADEDAEWDIEHYFDLAGQVAFPMLDVSVDLADIYDTLDPRPFARSLFMRNPIASREV